MPRDATARDVKPRLPLRTCALLLAALGVGGCEGFIEPAGARTQSAPGKPPLTPVGTDDCRPLPQRAWQLTPDQLANTVTVLLGKPYDVAARLKPLQATAKLFSNEADVLSGGLDQLTGHFNLGLTLSAEVMKQPSLVNACLPAGLADDACIRTAIADFGARAFRRPLETFELEDYAATFQAQAALSTRSDALRLMVRRVLLSPHFLYRFELGAPAAPGTTALNPYELASALSYFVSDGPPDAQLLAAAKSGALAQREELQAHVERLLKAPATSRGALKFFAEFFGTSLYTTRRPDIPNRSAVFRSMGEETRLFIEHVLWNDGAQLGRLLSTDYSFIDKELATHHGYPSVPTAFQKMVLPDRAGGLLSQPTLLVGRKGTTARGLFIRERLLCMEVPSPPDSVNTDLAEQQEKLEKLEGRPLTPREVRARHVSDPQCNGCHQLIDPLGFPFEAFDVAGRALSPAPAAALLEGAIAGTSRSDAVVRDSRELVGKLAASPDVRACFVDHLFQYAYGQHKAPHDTCFVDGLRRGFEQSQGNIFALIVDIALSDNFSNRIAASEP